MPHRSGQKLFQPLDTEMHQVLFCNVSDSEDALPLHEEDLNFLEEVVVK